MLNTYTVSFFGHREIEKPIEIEKKLDKLLYELITTKEYVEFLVGRDGEFDRLVSSAIRRAVKDYSCGNTWFVLVLPYMRAEYRNNEKYFMDYYDEVEICAESSDVHFKSAIQARNRSMVDRSDLVVCCIQHDSGGAYKTMHYAMERSRSTINLAENI